MPDDEANGGGTGSADERTAPPEPDAPGLDVTEEWPQLTPLELAVCLADSDPRPSTPRMPLSR
jgi:hypothetical protein